MTYNKAVEELDYHSFFVFEAGQVLSEKDKKRLDCALCMLQFYQDPVDWKYFRTRILTCFAAVNRRWNGVDPDMLVYDDKQKMLERGVILSVHRILNALDKVAFNENIRNQEQKKEAKRLGYILSELWLNILEGGDFRSITDESEILESIWNSKK